MYCRGVRVGLAGFHEASELRLTTGSAEGQALVYGLGALNETW
jgi:hypothetical protein